MSSRRLLAVFVLLMIGREASAQTVNARVRPDWWGEADIAVGSLGLGCDVCSGRVTGGGVGVGGGIRAGRLVELGVAATGFFGSKDGTSQRAIVIGPVARLYTSPLRTWQVRGGLGWQGYRAAEGTSRLTSSSIALSLGAARRWSIGRAGDLTPHVDLVVTPSSSLRQNDREIARASSTTLVLGLSLRFD